MKLLACAAIITFGLPIAAGSQDTTPHQNEVTETKGVCSPIAPNNRGSITVTCSGFSERENKRILELLHKLSDQRASEQDALLAKIEELLVALKASQKINTPRTIPPDIQEQIISYSNWAICAPTSVSIFAPKDDSEAQDLAVSIREVLRHVGITSRISYEPISKPSAETIDLKTVSTDLNGTCIEDYLVGNLKKRLAIVSEHKSSDAMSPERLRTPPFYIYVYPR